MSLLCDRSASFVPHQLRCNQPKPQLTIGGLIGIFCRAEVDMRIRSWVGPQVQITFKERTSNSNRRQMPSTSVKNRDTHTTFKNRINKSSNPKATATTFCIHLANYDFFEPNNTHFRFVVWMTSDLKISMLHNAMDKIECLG